MKVTKKIQKTFELYMKTKAIEQQLLEDIYVWLEDQEIDTHNDEFSNAIGVRIENSEFDSSAQFFEELKKYKNGEDVGYG